MAGLRNGAVMAMLFAAVAVLASLSAAEPASDTYGWDEYLADKQLQITAQDTGSADVALDGVTTSAFPAMGPTLTVGGNGFKTIQAAVNSIPKGNKKRYILYILNGVYKEKLLVEKDYVYFKCQSKKVVITYGDTAEKAGGTSKSASVAVEAVGFLASDCTFQNSAPAPAGGAVGKQAVALRIQGDHGAFYRCAFYGAQDTLYDKEGRHYFRSCDIVGSIDWIFGDGQSFYQYCKLTSIAKAGSGSVTAQKRETNSKTGFVFFQCAIGGTGKIYLGRAWGTHSRVIFYQCNIANMIRPEGWMDWADPSRQKTVYYAEYKCSGPGASRAGREKWSRVLTDSEAAPFGGVWFIDGKSWLQNAM